MLKEQFELAAAETKIQTPELVDAARAKLVDGENAADIATRLGIDNYNRINRAAASIEKKWLDICARNNWKFYCLALPETTAEAMRGLQAVEIERYKAAREKKKRKKEK